MTDLGSFFSGCGRVALAFSGGVDSTYLLSEAVRLGADVVPYHVVTEFGRKGDLDFARRMCGIIGADLRVIRVCMLEDPDVKANTPDRCYLCKRRIFSAVLEAASADGCVCVIDGTNASDDEGDRPGMRALRELGVKSPLRDAGLTKDMIREGSRRAGLPNWDLPSNSCLATRVRTGVPLERDFLLRAEAAEDAIRELGFTDLRVRTDGTDAFLEFRSGKAEAERRLGEVLRATEPFFSNVTMDRRCRWTRDTCFPFSTRSRTAVSRRTRPC